MRTIIKYIANVLLSDFIILFLGTQELKAIKVQYFFLYFLIVEILEDQNKWHLFRCQFHQYLVYSNSRNNLLNNIKNH